MVKLARSLKNNNKSWTERVSLANTGVPVQKSRGEWARGEWARGISRYQEGVGPGSGKEPWQRGQAGKRRLLQGRSCRGRAVTREGCSTVGRVPGVGWEMKVKAPHP